jgi:dTMP kinase
VVLEGIDGTGKTTLAKGLAVALEARGFPVLVTREPTDGPFGRRIRSLAAAGRGSVTPEEEFRLFHEDRKIHVRDVVRPALDRGVIVIQDRSYFSSVAYQGQRGLDRERLLRESEAIAPRPDLLLVVDLPVDRALERIRAARDVADDFEKRASLDEVRAAFLGFEGATVLDGAQTPDRLLGAALEPVLRMLGAG